VEVQAEHSGQKIESFDVVGREDMRARERTWRAEGKAVESSAEAVLRAGGRQESVGYSQVIDIGRMKEQMLGRVFEIREQFVRGEVASFASRVPE
jgi:hypothetical protein